MPSPICSSLYLKRGFQAGVSGRNTSDAAFDALFQGINYRGLDRALIARAQQMKDRVFEFLRGKRLGYVSVSIDGVTVGQRGFTNIDALVPGELGVPVTLGFELRSKFKTASWCPCLRGTCTVCGTFRYIPPQL
jgi:hypothetical protein